MQLMNKGRLGKLILGIGCAIMVASCSSGNSTTQSNGYLSVSYNGSKSINSIQVTNGSVQKFFVSLKDSSGVRGQIVRINVSNPDVASVYPSKCALSSGSAVNSTCMVTINGLQLGNTNINVSSNDYSTLSLPTVSQSAVVFGTFEVESYGQMLSNLSPVPVQYSATGRQIMIKASIMGSSGIDSSTSGVLNFALESVDGATISPNAAQACDGITSHNSTCSISPWTISSAGAPNITLVGSVAGGITGLPGFKPSTLPNPTYPNLVVSATQAQLIPGKIVVSSQSGNIVPIGMHAPVFVNWLNASESGSATITLTSTNPSVIKFYAFNESGIENTMDSVTCSLNNTIESELNCGFGVKSMTTKPNLSSSIVAVINSHTGSIPSSIESLVLTVSEQELPIRSIKFTNNSESQAIWVGITQGGANAFVSPTANTQQVSTTHDLTPGAVSMCGLSNPRAACPVGSTCRQGGAVVESTTKLFCFWDALVHVNGYKIESHGGSTVVNISASSRDPNGIIWSGNFFGRMKCNESGICQVGSCGNGTGLACAPGTGAAPGGVVTLGELTFQENNNPDYYDVSIINGVNFGLSFGPESSSKLIQASNNAYICGVAGSLESMLNWPSNTTSGLPAASWKMLPDQNSVYPFNGSVNDPQRFYRWVDNASSTVCNAESNCSGGLVCGYRLNSVYSSESGINQGTNSVYTQYCGHHVAWLTADTIAGFGAIPNTTSAESIFNLNASWANPVAGEPTIYVTNLQLCTINTFSSFQNPAPSGSAGSSLLACGGTLWSQYTRGSSGFTLVTNNQNWQDNVLPTINWLKRGCPTCYSYPFDDPTSTFTCVPSATAGKPAVYDASFVDIK